MKRAGNITSFMTIDRAEELCEMRMLRFKDLDEWGFEEEAEYVQQQAMFSYLKSVGKNGKYSEDYAAFLKGVKHLSPFLERKAKLMIAILRISQALFDAICILLWKRSFA